MNMKVMICAAAVLALGAATAAPTTRTTGRAGATGSRARAAAAAAANEDEDGGKAPTVRIEQYPKLGRQACLSAPSVPGGTTIGQAYTGKPRNWIVLEAKYQTQERCIDQLTFVWHVLLETKSATSKDKEGQAKLAPFSYFTQTVTYSNVGRGSHAASVCLHPSYLEQYGEPCAVGLVVQDSNGKAIAGDTVSSLPPSQIADRKGDMFWENPKVMESKQDNGQPYVERRQGLQDRSKTIWALVNPNDYELVVQ